MRTLLALLMFLTAACAAREAEMDGPRITLVDSIVLGEPPGDPLGGYTTFFSLTASGGVIVSDISSQRVLRFDSHGAFVGQVGRAGEGPGEFRIPAEIIALPQLDAFGVIDPNRSRLLLFSNASAAFAREVELPFQRAGSSIATLGDTIVFAPLMTGDALVQWASRTDGFAALAPLDLDVPGMQGIVMSMGVPGVARIDSTLLLWYPVIGLTSYRLDGGDPRHVAVSARLRRGEGVERVVEQMALREAGSDSTLFSTTLGIGRLGGGEVVLAALDARRSRTEDGARRESDIRVYLTVLDPTLQRACVDGLVPMHTDASSIMVMHEGDPHFLARTVNDDGTVRTVVYRYRVDVSGCEWGAVNVKSE